MSRDPAADKRDLPTRNKSKLLINGFETVAVADNSKHSNFPGLRFGGPTQNRLFCSDGPVSKRLFFSGVAGWVGICHMTSLINNKLSPSC